MIRMLKMNIRRFGQLDYRTKEALNTLSTNLSLAGGNIKKIMLTSCHAGEGKSFISMNLMRSFAELGLRVVLVDADIRASRLASTYDIQVDDDPAKRSMGLTSYLAGWNTLDDVLGMTDIPNAYMILAGKTVMNSLSLLSSAKMQELLDELSHRFDLVLVDAPPVGTIIDPARIAESCDGLLVVVQSGSVVVQELADVMRQLEKTRCPILGTVLNMYDEQRYGDRYYYHKYSYYNRYTEGRKKTAKNKRGK